MSISLIRTILGEDILATVKRPLSDNGGDGIIEDADYVLKRPMRIMAGPGRDGKTMEVGLGEAQPFGLVPNPDITIKGSKIMYITQPNAQFEPMYKQATTTSPPGLILPGPPKLSLVG